MKLMLGLRLLGLGEVGLVLGLEPGTRQGPSPGSNPNRLGSGTGSVRLADIWPSFLIISINHDQLSSISPNAVSVSSAAKCRE